MPALILPALAAATWCYLRGGRRGRSRVRLACWLGGCAALIAAFAPPLEQAAHATLTGHMIQHLLLTTAAAPLLVLSAPVVPLLSGLPVRARRLAADLHRRIRPLQKVTRAGVWPLLAVAIYTAGTWAWHLPAVYDAALASPLVHAGGHATLLGVGLVLWWTVAAAGQRTGFGHGTGIAVLFVAALQHAGLSSLLLFAPTPLYAHTAGLDDQRLAAVVMATPAKLVYGLAVVILVFAWLSSMQRRLDAAPGPTVTGRERA